MYTLEMFTEQQLLPLPFGKITQLTHDEHKKLYTGYVKNANLIMEHGLEFAKDSEKYMYELGELQRRFSFEWGGIRNHEVYFKLLEGGAHAPDPESALYKRIIAQWDSIDIFVTRMTMTALTRGIGWSMLYYNRATDSILVGWVDEQHIGQLADCEIIIAIDMWEHSYVADYQPSGKKQYIQDFFAAMNWANAEALYTNAQKTL
jgi:Fe-Mn family superoxide dismutase